MNGENPTKKILFLITKSNWGGAQKYVYEMASATKKAGFSTIVALGGDGLLKDRLEENEIETISIKNLQRDISIFKECLVFFDLLKIIKEEKPDIIHVNSSKIGGLGSFAGRIMFIKKIVFTAHGWVFNENRNSFYKLITKFLSWLTIIFSHKTIVLSQKEFDQVHNWPFSKNKLEIVPIGIKTLIFFDKEEARTRLVQKNSKLLEVIDDIWIGTIGELTHNKGYTYSLEAMASNKIDAQYVIIGDGEDRLEMEELIKKHPHLKEVVKMVGNIKDAGNYLKAFDVFLLPSVKEGLPYTLLEAGLSETPIITTKVGGIPELIDENTGILINSKSPSEINYALEKLLENKDLYKEKAQKLKEKIESEFSIENMVEKTIAVYNS